MSKFSKKILFGLFFFSGFCGLLYQVVWMRMALASFGVITPVISIVISVFMLGLFVGSWAAGKSINWLTARTRLSAVWFYAAAELLIAIGAFAVPRLFAFGETFLLASGETDSFAYLFRSSLIISGALFPWCVFMGTTFPFMMSFVKEQDTGENSSFSFLYLANVIGAMLGTLITALVLVESLGFRSTLYVAAAINVGIALVAGYLGFRFPLLNRGPISVPTSFAKSKHSSSSALFAPVLFMTGFTSMAMEVVWTRGFAAVLKTQVYSFAALLFVYLLATWIGSLFYRRHLNGKSVIPTGQLASWLALSSIIPVILNDPRLYLGATGALVSIFPFCALLGYLTPKLIDEYSLGFPKAAGFAYAINIFGCILGPLFASYILLPQVGLKYSLLILAAPYTVLFFYYVTSPQRGVAPQWSVALAILLAITFFNESYEDRTGTYRGAGVIRRDHTATVISFGEGMQKRLLVNGVGITHLTTTTKLMAHLPMALLPTPPQSALVICLGMGTTYRSLMSWGVNATAVELVPSVKEAFPYYFADAREVLAQPNGKIVVDDGRRYLRRTDEMFDVITLDPPPPVEAAGSSLLYSEEFYSAVKQRLKPNAVLQQWIPAAEDKIVHAVVKSLLNSFPHVRMFGSLEQGGHHFLASEIPIHILSATKLASRLPNKARADLVEWTGTRSATELFEMILGLEIDPREFNRSGGGVKVTDDKPFNEYYLIRRAARALGLG